MDNNEHIDRLFSRVFEDYELKPSSDIWNRIQDDLDKTQKNPVNIPYARYAAMLFIFVSLCFLVVPSNKRNPVAQIRNYSTPYLASEQVAVDPIWSEGNNENTSLESKTLAIAENVVSNRKTSENMTALKTVASNNIKSDKKNVDYIYAPASMDDESLSADKIDIINRIYNSDVSIPLFSFDAIGEEADALFALQSGNTVSKFQDLDMRGIYIGISGSYNQTSIIESGNIFKGERPIQPSLKFGTSKGFVLGYNFSNKFGVQAEYIYNSIQGQNYVMSEEGDITQKSLSLHYDLIPVTAKIKVGRISDITNKPVILNYTIGAQYGMLREYRLPQDKRYETTEVPFKYDEISLVLGLEYDIYFQDNVYFSAGARGTISNDITSLDAPATDDVKRNFVFGVRGSLNYVFR